MKIVEISFEQQTDRGSHDDCYVAMQDVSYSVNWDAIDRLRDMIVVTYDEGSEGCESGMWFRVCGFTETSYLVDPKEKKFYKLFTNIYNSHITHSNAVEVCGDHGCYLTPACPISSDDITLTMWLEPVDDPEEQEEILDMISEHDKAYPALEYLYEYLNDYVSYQLDNDEITLTDENRKRLTELLKQIKSVAEEQKLRFGNMPRKSIEIIEKLFGTLNPI